MDFSRIYEMDHSFRTGVFHFQPLSAIQHSEAILRGEEPPLRSLEFRPMKGSIQADIMGTTFVALRLISKRFANLLLENQFTGWGTVATRIQDKRGKEIPGYFCLVVSGRAGPIDPSRNRIVLDPPPVPHGEPTYVEVGMYFDPMTWDGSDIFIPEGTTAICVTERVKDVVDRAKIENVQFTALSKFQGNRFLKPPPGRNVSAPSAVSCCGRRLR
jgi:hypothetical protein